jgi:hypothetical protein
MLGSIDKIAAAGDHRRVNGIFVRRNRKTSRLAVLAASSFAPRMSATANCKES